MENNKPSKLENVLWTAGGMLAGAGITGLALYNPIAAGTAVIGGVVSGGFAFTNEAEGDVLSACAFTNIGTVIGLLSGSVAAMVGTIAGYAAGVIDATAIDDIAIKAMFGGIIGGTIGGGVVGAVGVDYIPNRNSIKRGLAAALIASSSVLIGNYVVYKKPSDEHSSTIEQKKGKSDYFIQTDSRSVPVEDYFNSEKMVL